MNEFFSLSHEAVQGVIQWVHDQVTSVRRLFMADRVKEVIGQLTAQLGVHNQAEDPFEVEITEKPLETVAEIFLTQQPSQQATIGQGYAITGTRPHIIRGNPVLRWINKFDQPVYATFVLHPGIQPREPLPQQPLDQQAVELGLIRNLRL
jgi:hypothetical protein